NPDDYTITFAVPAGRLAALVLSPDTAFEGRAGTRNRIYLTAADPAKATVISLSSTNPAVAQVPPTITIPAGSTMSDEFTISTTSVTTSTPLEIRATHNGSTVSDTFRVNPVPVAAVALESASTI